MSSTNVYLGVSSPTLSGKCSSFNHKKILTGVPRALDFLAKSSANGGGVSGGSQTPTSQTLNLPQDSRLLATGNAEPCMAANITFSHTFLGQEHQYPLSSDQPYNGLSTLTDDLRHSGRDVINQSYKEKFVIRCFEVGMNGTASLETMANLLQEVACNHAQSVGFSTDGFATTPLMRKRHLIWVTTRMHIEMDEYPMWGDVVQVETWCQSEGKIGTRRDWILTNVASGKAIGRATSTWVMMSQDTRRLYRITDDVRDEYMQYCPTKPRYAFPEENSGSLRKISKLEDPAQHIRAGLMPRRGDLDMNQHVNNVTYISWILECVPQQVLDTHEVHKITLDYRRECNYGDTMESLANLEEENKLFEETSINGSTHIASDSLSFLHILRLDGCHTEINRGRTVWRAKCKRCHNESNA